MACGSNGSGSDGTVVSGQAALEETPALSPGDVLPRYRIFVPGPTNIKAAQLASGNEHDYLVLLYQPLDSLDQFAAPPGELPEGFEEDTFVGRVLADLKSVQESSSLPSLMENTFFVAAFRSPMFATRTVHEDVVDG